MVRGGAEAALEVCVVLRDVLAADLLAPRSPSARSLSRSVSRWSGGTRTTTVPRTFPFCSFSLLMVATNPCSSSVIFTDDRDRAVEGVDLELHLAGTDDLAVGADRLLLVPDRITGGRLPILFGGFGSGGLAVRGDIHFAGAGRAPLARMFMRPPERAPYLASSVASTVAPPARAWARTSGSPLMNERNSFESPFTCRESSSSSASLASGKKMGLSPHDHGRGVVPENAPAGGRRRGGGRALESGPGGRSASSHGPLRTGRRTPPARVATTSRVCCNEGRWEPAARRARFRR
jgi:hypothetical protein